MTRRRARRRRAWPAVRPVAHRCASSCDDGPHRGTLLIQAESQAVVLRSGVAPQCGPPTAPVRLSAGLRRHQAAEIRSATACQCPAAVPRGASDVPMAMSHHGMRRTISTRRERNTLQEPLAALRGFLEPRIEATARVASILFRWAAGPMMGLVAPHHAGSIRYTG